LELTRISSAIVVVGGRVDYDMQLPTPVSITGTVDPFTTAWISRHRPADDHVDQTAGGHQCCTDSRSGPAPTASRRRQPAPTAASRGFHQHPVRSCADAEPRSSAAFPAFSAIPAASTVTWAGPRR
jgi:hypothetical protein